MPLQRIDTARNNLANARNSYADIQRQLDRYNRVFEAYAQASPETQIRANSVMRQAINEYNGLKKQQEENALKIYEAQQWVDYYNKSTPNWLVSSMQTQTQPNVVNSTQVQQTNNVPTLTTPTPWTLNDMAPVTNQEEVVQEITTPTTASTINGQNAIRPTTPIWVTNIINSQIPKYPNTTISPATPTYTYAWAKYGGWSVATMPNTQTYPSVSINNRGQRFPSRRNGFTSLFNR